MNRKTKDLLTLNFWRGIEGKEIPRWVIKGAVKSHLKHHVDRRFLKGNHYIYRVDYEPIAQGETKFHYYKKKKTI